MARHANPIEEQHLKGADRTHPERYRKEVPKSALPLGQFPAVRSTSPEEIWFELSSFALPGVMTGADRFMLEMACELLAEFRSGPREFQVGKYTHLISLLARFGMSPSDRTKFGIDKPNSDDALDHLDD